MNEQIYWKTTKNEWGNDNSNFLVAFFLHTLLTNLFKQRDISSVTSYKYLNKLISEK